VPKIEASHPPAPDRARSGEPTVARVDMRADAQGEGGITTWPASASAAGRFLGRARELSVLLSTLDLAVCGQGSVVTISGDPGIGKTRIAEELAELAAKRAVPALWGRCSEDPGAPPYWPWVQLIRAHVGSRPVDLLRAEMGASAGYIAEMAPEVVRRIGRVAAVLRPPDAAQARFGLFDALTGFWRRATATEPLLLIFDDLHCADTPSLKLLEFLAKEIGSCHLLIVGTYRSSEISLQHPLSDALGGLGRHARLQRLSLSGISAEESRELALAILGPGLGRDLTAKIHERTEGNPLFLHEMIRYLQEIPEDQQAEAWRRLTERLPDGIRQTIGVRLNKLSTGCMSLLEVAAVAGRHFALDVVTRAVPDFERGELLSALDEAISVRIIEATAEPSRFRFTHALLREVLYEHSALSRRTGLHERIGRAMEERYAQEIGPYLSALAHHFCSSLPGGHAAKAVEMALRAGEYARDHLGFEDAASHFQAALKAMDHEPDACISRRAEVQIKLGRMQSLSGDSVHSLESFRRAVNFAKQAREPELQTRAAIAFEEASWRFPILAPAAIAPLHDALEALGPDDSAQKAGLLSSIARCLLFTGAAGEAFGIARSAIAMARRMRDEPALVEIVFRSLPAYDLRPNDFDERLALTEEAIMLARRVGNRELLLYLVSWHVHNLSESGDMVARSQFLEEMGRLADERRQPLYQYVWRCHHALTAIFEGRFDEAVRIASQAADFARNLPQLDAPDAYSVHMLSLRREQGRLGDVAPILAQFERSSDADSQWRPGLMIVYAELGQLDKARAIYDAFAQERFATVALDGRWLMTLAYLSEMCVLLNDAASAPYLYRALRAYEGFNLVVGHNITTYGPTGRYLGMLASAMQEWTLAEQHFTAAIEMNVRQGSKPWLAHAQYQYAAMLNARGAQGDRSRALDLLESASKIADGLEMKALAARVGALRSAIKPARARAGYPAGLSRREVEVLRLVAQGKSNREIARRLFVSKNTVAKQVGSILAKTDSANRTEAAAFALRHKSLFDIGQNPVG
jgi:DNA-binding CsgD family transcriptional regulator